jgi:uncharacterized membrane protein YhaH (DUF805 family)
MNYLVRIYNGRLNRKRYGLGLLLCAGCIIAVGAISAVVLVPALKKIPGGGSIAAVVFVLILLPAYVAHLFSLYARRLHDLGKSGWYSLLCLVPYINLIVLIYLLLKKGPETANRFGEVPSKEMKLLDALLNRA